MDQVFYSVISYIAIPIYICSLFGNFLVILVMQKDKKLRESPNTFFLLGLAHADFWFSVIVFVNIIFLSRQASYAFTEFVMNALASIYILVALAAERYFAILKPFVHRRRATKRLLCKVLLAIYVLAGVLSAPGYYITYLRRQEIQYSLENTTTNRTGVTPAWFETLSTLYSFVLFVFGYILPSAGIVFCYSRVIYHVWFNADASRATNAGLLKSRRKLTKLFILITVIFIITWTPTFVRIIATKYSKHEQDTLKFELLTMLLGLVGSTANPVIYSFRCPKFRQEVIKLLTFCCKRNIQPHTNRIVATNRYSLTNMKSAIRRKPSVDGPVSLVSIKQQRLQ